MDRRYNAGAAQPGNTEAEVIKGREQNMERMELKGKKVTVVGLAKSGTGAANLLSEMGAEVTVTDMKHEDELIDSIKMLAPSIRLALQGHPDDIFKSADMIVVSPGVPLDIKPIQSAKANGIPVLGELELAFQIVSRYGLQVPGKNKDSSPYFLAVTGSNGKSTTTTLLDYMMRKGGFKTILAGNIGSALTGEIYKIVTSCRANPPLSPNNSSVPPYVKGGEGGFERGGINNSQTGTAQLNSPKSRNSERLSVDFIVVEVSSFQLEAIDKFRPHIASILNITPDHLDRYYSMSEYSNAKAQIFINQQDIDHLVLNADDPEVMKVTDEKLGVRIKKPKMLYFSRKNKVKGIYCSDGKIHCNMPRVTGYDSHFPFIGEEEIKIKGVHNLENAMAASAMALLANCPLKAVIESLKEFEGLEHRLEFVREIDGVKYFNDSKGTNVGAVLKSIESFQEPLILIAGGRDKAGDFSILRNSVEEKVKALVLIGEAGGKIRSVLGDLKETIMAKDLNEAVKVSHDIADKGDVVLLSPACASFDMFQDFEDRGRQFKKIVMELLKLNIEN